MMAPMSDKKIPVRLALIPLLAAIGASAAIYLSKTYYDLRGGTGGFNSLCNLNSTFNCDAVTASRYAEVFAGLPLSSVVAGWFIAILVLGLMARNSEWRKEVVLTGTLMSGFGSLYSIALLFVMMGVLQKICLFCLVIDGVNFALFGIFLSMRSGGVFEGIRLPKLQSHALIIVVSIFIMIVFLRPAEENARKALPQSEVEYSVNRILETPSTPIATPENAPIMGSKDAPITIHEFSDFQCPYCKRGALMTHQLMARHPGKIQVVYMPFPLDGACNRLVPRSMHPYACELAKTALCASREGTFEPVYQKIFEEQDLLNAKSASVIAKANGLDSEKTRACVESEETKKALSDSIEEGAKAGVQSTPTFFVNGRKVEGLLPMEAWDLLIQRLIAEKK
jgi:protein-disulfide isomerase/uncharacterized membrane protein